MPATDRLVSQVLSGPGLTATLLSEWDALDRIATERPCPRGLAASGGLPGELRVATLRRGARLVGVWPMVRLELAGEGVLVAAGGSAQHHDGPTLHPDVEPSEAMATLWGALRSEGDVDAIHLRRFRAQGLLAALTVAAPRMRPTGTSQEVWVESSPEPDRTSAGASFLHLTHPEARWTAMSHALGWRLQGPPTREDEQLLSLTQHPATVEMFSLQVDGVAVAVQVGLREGRRYTVGHTRVNPAFEDCGAEGLLLLEVAAWCAGRGVTTLDLGPTVPADTPWLGVVRTVQRYEAIVSVHRTGAPPSRLDRATAAPLLAVLRARPVPSSVRGPVRRVA